MTAIDRLHEILLAAGAAVSLAPLPPTLRTDAARLVPVRVISRHPAPTRH
jgi:hypothetical protein